MTKSELIVALAERYPALTRTEIDAAVAEILGAIALYLNNGGRIEIRGFGSFAVNYRPPRLGRNPATGERVAVPGKWRPHFKAGKELRALVDYPND